MASTLCVHSKRFNAKHVSFEDLTRLPDPDVLGSHHKPIRHDVLIAGFRAEAERRNMVITREQFALGAKDAALFGVIDFAPAQTTALVPVESDRNGESGLSLGFRSANDMSLAVKAVAGARVFVCDNLALSGDMFAISRKHTHGLDLADAIQAGFAKFAAQTVNLVNAIQSLHQRELTDDEAKVAIFELFEQGVLPVKLFADVSQFYFGQSDDRPDCLPRTAWGLHNAVTRAIKSLKPIPAFQRTVAVGKFFGLTGEAPQRIYEPAGELVGAN